jgi:hypothetical protein
MSAEDIKKLIAFQVGQVLAIMDDVELYTKSEIADYLEGLKPYLYRNSENDKDLKGYLYLLWHTLYYNQIFNYTENETEVTFTFTHKTYDTKTEKLIN